MIVYHGSMKVIDVPQIIYSMKHVDFGPGFYVTTVKEQAERWASRKAMRHGGTATVSCYEVGDLSAFKVRQFADVDEDLDWLRFVVNCRNGADIYKDYDVVIGKVANDDVFKCVNMLMDGYWDEERTLQEIRYFKNYDQMAFITQEAIDSAVVFREAYEVVG